MRLSPRQLEMIAAMSSGKISQTGVHVYGGPRTVRSLEEKGLVRYYPYGDHGHGSYGLTDKGRKVADRLTDLQTNE
jgi:hypothetical protein